MEPALLLPLDAALRGACLALLLMLAAQLARLPQRRPLEQVSLAIAIGLWVQVAAAWPPIEYRPPDPLRALAVGVSTGNVVLFWLWVRTLCDDGFAPGRRHAALWAAVVGVGTLNLLWWLPALAFGDSAVARVGRAGAVALQLGFTGAALGVALRRWRDDLVERRRGVRLVILFGGSAYALAQAWARAQRDDNRLTPGYAAVDAALLLAVVAAATWMLLRAKRGELTGPVGPVGPTAPSPAPEHGAGAPSPTLVPAAVDVAPATAAGSDEPAAAPDPADQQLAAALHAAMAVDRIYRDPELSVAGLAARLRVPEYRLRRVINRQLGHRNFAAFLNGHRLDEACRALADPAKAHLPVLTLALEAGFGSIGPFNRAFKAHTGLTPTEFRQRKLADS